MREDKVRVGSRPKAYYENASSNTECHVSVQVTRRPLLPVCVLVLAQILQWPLRMNRSELEPVSSDKQCPWCSHTGKAMFWTSFSSRPIVQWGSRFLSSLFRVYNKSCHLLRVLYPLNTVLSHFVFRIPWGEVIGKISVLPMKKLRFKEIFSKIYISGRQES